ncbi:homocysteine S-methyltransferase family protein [Aestuariirhabdus sp. Z084]|uniref:homocysteine S-methyltransferase family protein n=1 Tax=Aestuariirhabdus haliotis TaxID=2918751 RepID=UPI00201B4537|nr:homocysteine S-methyltransferase family protein [Aestuariirhabdus haliotis]MCL6416648.1 homocysteine S-methyltransferase family protein [Aestuariirhabdus haliotis]MCL6420683.1 homocysteine S-methyltransferase family protein [Aestuariirhabdus haliotis]
MMPDQSQFPLQKQGRFYLAEGGTETELMYKYGFEFDHFALFPLLENPAAVETLRGMYRRYLEVVARQGLCALMGGLDYRASPDWGALLGYSPAGLAEATQRSIAFLKELAKEFAADIPEILIQGLVGPRGDAYERNEAITVNEAEDYHSVQLTTLKAAEVDLALAITFSNVPEAIGAARAAARIGIPLAVSLSLDSRSTLNSGESLADAIATIDSATEQTVEFYSINCSHPIEYEPAIEDADWIHRVRGVRPNASKMDKMALCEIGHLEAGDPVELGRLCGDLARRYPHMDIWGGCCGTWDVHLEEIARHIVAAQAPSETC